MQSLLFDVSQPPEAVAAEPLALSAYPQLLLEGKQLWKRLEITAVEQLIEAVRSEEPAVLAFLGPQAISQAWQRVSEELFPRLFALAHPVAETEAVIDQIHTRSMILRRQRLASRPPQQPATGSTDLSQLFAALPGRRRRNARQLAETMIETYALAPLLAQLEVDVCERGLYCLALLESRLGALNADPQLLDINCHRWSYAPFLQAYGARYGAARLMGLERDPWYLQPDGLTRADWARHYAQLASASFLDADPRDQALPEADLITLFLPLILPQHALRWGLPSSRHDPIGLLRHLYGLLKPGGQLLIYSGIEVEHLAGLELLKALGWPPSAAGPYTCPLRQSQQGFSICLQA